MGLASRADISVMINALMREYQAIGETIAHCDKHGDYTASITATGKQSPCPLCLAEQKAQAAKRAAEQKNAQILANLGKYGIPKRHRHCRVHTYQASLPAQKALKAEVAAYAQAMISGSLKRNLVLLGNCGTGKTHLACAVGMAALTAGKTVLFATASEIIRRVQAAHKSATETEWALMSQLARLDLLIIDELGVQYATESANRIITEIVNARYENELPTIFISNLSVAAFADLMGERAMSRMREDGCKPFVCDWQDYRTIGART